MLATWPAAETFRDDPRRTLVMDRVFHHLTRNVLDFSEVRQAKAYTVAHDLHIDPKDVSVALAALTAWGYLIDHGRAARNIRRLTIAWTVREELRRNVAGDANSVRGNSPTVRPILFRLKP